MLDYTYFFNQFSELYYKTKNKDIEKQSMGKLCEIVYKVTPYVYYNYVCKKKIFRTDNEDMVDACCVRLLERVKRWKDKQKGAYLVQYLTTVIFNEVRFALNNEKQKFYDNVESLDVYNDNIRAQEGIEDD